ncbi:MAG: lysylphosphatidylglycerol synthase transmembrane domain-containing protein [Gordonia sp. (in: high G+C Gram-positive bacteria)]|uniref:lysylphosphatidylglycerol synthase transmembrane domain-containing protein n=1 Tax=Gordonia sp. (in: high G+C Gram-positive bacteria) TaxID=84139 RepID=UPI0039E5086A
MAKSPRDFLRRNRTWLRWIVIIAVAAILVVEAYLIRDQFGAAWRRVGDIHWGWLTACFVASMLNLDSFARVQRALFHSAGVIVSQWRSLSVILAANSLSQTMPGGQVLAPAFTYRETRRWGANPVVASWQVVMAGLISGVGLMILGLVGALMAGGSKNPYSVVFSILGVLAFLAVLQYLVSHPATVHAWGSRILRWHNDLRNWPESTGQERLARMIDQLGAVQLTRTDGMKAFGWSLFNWITDIFCLLFACWALGTRPSIAGVALAYAVSKGTAAAVAVLPGGIGPADVAMMLTLGPAGVDQGTAAVVVILYRLVSWLLVSLIGWVVIAVMFRSRIKGDVDDVHEGDDLEEGLRAGPPADPDRPLVDFTDDQRRLILGHDLPEGAEEDDYDDEPPGPPDDEAWKLP